MSEPARHTPVPRVPRWQGVRDARAMIANPVSVLARHVDRLGPSFHYSFGGVRDALITTNPVFARHVLKTNHKNFHKSEIQTGIMAEFLGEGLLTDRWENWRPKRQRLAKAFHPHSLDGLGPAIEAALQDALLGLEARAAAGQVSFKEEVTLITFAMAARSFFGMSFPLDDIGTLSGLIKSIQAFMTKLVVMPFLRPWWQLSGELARQQRDRASGDALLQARIEERLEAPASDTPDLLDLLLEMADPDTDSVARLTLPQVLAEAMQILVAGHETSSNAFTWLMLLLDANPRERDIVTAEFAEVLGQRAPVFSDIENLPRTNSIVEEALRMFPPFWMIDRVALADDMIAGVPIPRGTTIVIFLYGLHRDPTLWSQPDQFQTDRFDNSLWQHREFFHIPFGAGPRRCIGVNYAKLQIFTLLHRFVDQYDVTFLDGNTPGIDPKFILSPLGPVRAHITRKHQTQ
ncbi:cytochrome P450 [Meridianimarinicoccus sp. MJW13]|uniref:cytochrome P450 n=1 Tax=Meridianimarinicoccus sp. MJW13 TaxID=2720031 RepID=UPI001867A683|nr:cytochrome P450 [Fluviibacterium sp. MJW13]